MPADQRREKVKATVWPCSGFACPWAIRPRGGEIPPEEWENMVGGEFKPPTSTADPTLQFCKESDLVHRILLGNGILLAC